ncbi:NIPSNAP family protein [Rhodoplanes sp.]|uniref:NIPSNAP family protein n=1 Tax=Rhodoplanes sp. TaxID=1968906 RepID=UPI0025E0E8DF|nr:NIPSNAP family protein [Rhodoplanes sp.]
MLVDHRTSRIKPTKVQAYLDLDEEHGMAAQMRHLGRPVADMFSESGELDTVVHIWAYEDATERAARRAAMLADPEGKAYQKLNSEAGLLVEQKTSLMIPASFAPIRR